MAHTSRRARLAGAAALLLLVAGCGSDDEAEPASTPATAAPATTGATTASTGGADDVLAATRSFLALLDDAGRTNVQGERSAENLAQWSNLPDQLFKRTGLRMDALSDDQRAAVLKILEAGLSADGYRQVNAITAGDGVLKDAGGMDLDFGADHYWIRILGTPSEGDIWTVQYGGHHLAVNMTMKGEQMTLAPTLWGAQPASYTASGATVEPLSGETGKAFAVIDALDDDQRDAAVLDSPITEIVLGAQQDGKTLTEEGVQASTFTDAQKKVLLALITEWLSQVDTGDAEDKIATAEENLDKTWFAWSGETTAGKPIYYRVQGPSLIIEFAHQHGQGANAGGVTHIHAIYREPGNDYGAELN
jgi:uncharacterized protein DUF3500